MPTRVTERHRRELAVAGVAVGQQVRSVALRANVNDIDQWWKTTGPRIQRITVRGYATAATLGARYLTAHAAEAGAGAVDPVPVAADLAQFATSLRVMGPVAFKTNIARSKSPAIARRVMTNQLTGSAQRLAMAGARHTIDRTVADSTVIVGYRRITAAGACKFCTMLADRGAVFLSARSASSSGGGRGTRAKGQPFHDNCRCTIEPVYGPR